MNRRDTAGLLAMLASAYPQVKVTREVAEMYHRVLEDLIPEDCYAVVHDLVRTEQFFPNAAQIRRAVMRRHGRLAPSTAMAWAEVIGAASSRGLDDKPEWSHPAVDATVNAMGWRMICMSDNQGVLRAQFGKSYDSIAADHDRAILTGPAHSLQEGSAPRGLPEAQDPAEGV